MLIKGDGIEDAPLVVDEVVEDEEMIAVVIVVVPLPLVPVSLLFTDLPQTAVDEVDPSDTLSNLIAPGTPLEEAVDSLRTDSSLLDDRILSRSSPLQGNSSFVDNS